MDFGKYAIIDDAKYFLANEPKMWWEFKPPTADDEIAIARYMNDGPVTSSVTGVTRQAVKTNAEICQMELALLFGGTNIGTDPDDESKKPILDIGDAIEKKQAVVAKMPSPLFWELWRAMGVRVPGWGARVPKENSEGPKATS